MKLNVFVSRPISVPEARLEGFYQRLDDLGLSPQTLGVEEVTLGIPLKRITEMLQNSQGAIILGFSPEDLSSHSGQPPDERDKRTTEWNHIEAGIAYALGIPLLIVRGNNAEGGIFDKGASDVYVHTADFSSNEWAWSPGVGKFLKEFCAAMFDRLRGSELRERHKDEKKQRLLTIREPAEAVFLPQRDVVRGAGPDDVDVWVVVHPARNQRYFVQGHARAKHGEWKVKAEFGNDQNKSGDVFEIRAIVGPREPISDDATFDHWPEAEYESFTRFVFRQ